MSKEKLKDLISRLEEIKREYKEEFDKEPQVWSIDSFGDEINSIELCHSYRRHKGGIGHTADDIKEYHL